MREHPLQEADLNEINRQNGPCAPVWHGGAGARLVCCGVYCNTMSSLWTPDGERAVPPKPTAPPSGGDSADTGSPSGSASESLRAAASQLGIDLDSMSPDDIAQLEAEMAEMMRARREMAETPAADMVANHMMRLFDLTMIYLEAEPPRFADATTVIESFRAVIDHNGDRLGAHAGLLNDALNQMQMVFIQVKEAQDS